MPPATINAQLCSDPAAIAATPLDSPSTGIGTLDGVVLPLPSWPTVLEPQHSTPPPVVSAQVWLPPAATAATAPERPVTATGTVVARVLPLPSWPLPPRSQHT